MKKLQFKPPESLDTIEIGQCVDMVTKIVKSEEASIFDPKALKKLALLEEKKAQMGEKKFSKVCTSNEMEVAKSIGFGIKGDIAYKSVRAAGEYSYNSGKARLTTGEMLRIYFSYVYSRAHMRLDYGPARKTDMISALRKDVKKAYFKIVQAKKIADKYAAYIEFLNTYGHGCITRVNYASGSSAQLTLGMQTIASKSESQHNGSFSISYRDSANLQASVALIKKENTKFSQLQIDYTMTNFPANTPTQKWMQEMETLVIEPIISKEFDQVKEPNIVAAEPKFKEIEPYSDDQMNSIYKSDIIGLMREASNAIIQEQFFGALALYDQALDIAQKHGLEETEIKEKRGECIRDIKIDFNSYKEKVETKTVFLKLTVTKMINIYDFFTLCKKVGTVIKASTLQETIANNITRFEEFYNKIKQEILQKTVKTNDRLSYIKFLQFYKTVEGKTKSDTDINDKIQQLKDYNKLSAIGLDFTEAEYQHPDIKLRLALKKEDGFEAMELTTYLLKYVSEKRNFYTTYIIKEILRIESGLSHLSDLFLSQETKLNKEEVLLESKETKKKVNLNDQYCATSCNYEPWHKILPGFDFAFEESLTGIYLGKINIFYLTRLQFGQYLSSYANYDENYEQFSSNYTKACSELYDLLVRETKKTNVNFEDIYHQLIGTFYSKLKNSNHKPNTLLKIYKHFYDNYEYFRRSRLGYNLIISLDRNKEYIKKSSLNITDAQRQKVSTFQLSKTKSLINNYRCFPLICYVENGGNITTHITPVAFCETQFSPNITMAKVYTKEVDYSYYYATMENPIVFNSRELDADIIKKTSGTDGFHIAQFLIDEDGNFAPRNTYGNIEFSFNMLTLDPESTDQIKGKPLFNIGIEWVQKPES